MEKSDKLPNTTGRNQWLILAIIITALIPVTIDATILHVAIPTLTLSLGASGNEVLWIIDVYPLIMAGLLLPMGILGDKIGHKKVLLFGLTIFGIASFLAGFSSEPIYLILSRGLLALGGSMIMPVTLAIISQTFTDEGKRGTALGIWAAVGTAGAAVGPVIGGIIVEHYWWGAVFLINLPLILIVIPLIWIGIPKGISNPDKPWIIQDAALVLLGVILFVYSIKTLFKEGHPFWISICVGIVGLLFLRLFFNKQKKSSSPMIDMELLKNKRILLGMLLCFVPMAVIVGFEFLLAQELQFVHKLSPINAGLFMLPFVVSSAIAGPLTGSIIGKIGFRNVIITVLSLSSLSFFMLSRLDFSLLTGSLLFWLIALGFSLGMVLIAATTSIMSAAPLDKAGMAGSMESISYELGTGLGITFFGIILSQIFTKKFIISDELLSEVPKEVNNSIGDAMIIANDIGGEKSVIIKKAAMTAFQDAHNTVLILAGFVLAALTLILIFVLPKEKR
jgi:DHA2 family multidrug resistance protein-like MFS transporter